jgi:hypothetical protein
MPRTYCTLFDSTYLPRGIAMAKSLRRWEHDATLVVFCMDEPTKTVLDRLELPGVEAIALEELEAHDPALLGVKADRTPLEYCWTATPCVAQACLDRNPALELITYLDADVYFFSDPRPLFDELGDDAVMIVPHRYTAALAHLQETSGTYNVELVSFRRDEDGLEALGWWRDRCIEWCYYRYEDGKLGDQKYLDDWTHRFRRVHVLRHVGGGLAPWNVKQYRLDERDGEVIVDDVPVVFYHFHGLRLFRDSPYAMRRPAVPTTGFSAWGASFRWASAYEASADEQRLVWDPYFAALAEAFSLISSVEPRFHGGFATSDRLVWRFGRSHSKALFRRIRRAVLSS